MEPDPVRLKVSRGEQTRPSEPLHRTDDHILVGVLKRRPKIGRQLRVLPRAIAKDRKYLGTLIGRDLGQQLDEPQGGLIAVRIDCLDGVSEPHREMLCAL